MKTKLNFRTKCLVCNSSKVKDIINLGNQPFADTFIPFSRIADKEKVYPLICQICKNCKNIQLKYKTNPNLRYNDYEYSYTSSNSNFSKSHWDNFFMEISNKFKVHNETTILEIGSNDGYLLKNFKSLTNKIVGLDASKKMTFTSKQMGIFSINGLLNNETKKLITNKYKKFDLIIANNVINHMDELKKSLKIVKTLLIKEGMFIFEQPYWLDTILTKRYDQIYHEHITYFTVTFAKNLAEILDMDFHDFEIINYHGKSIRLYFVKKSNNNIYKSNRGKISKQIHLEKKLNLFNEVYYKKFMENIIRSRNKILEKILNHKNNGNKIICIGAAAKSNTWLNFHKLDSSIISYITDRSSNKINKLTPMSRIKILSDDEIKKEKKPLIIILTWNIYDILSKKIKSINKSAKLLKV